VKFSTVEDDITGKQRNAFFGYNSSFILVTCLSFLMKLKYVSSKTSGKKIHLN